MNIDIRTTYQRLMDYYLSFKSQTYKNSQEIERDAQESGGRKLRKLERKIKRVDQENLTKKEKRIIGRHLRLIEAIKEGVAYCIHPEHPGQITPHFSCKKKCHVGNHGKGYCQHLKPNYYEWPHSKP